MSMGPVWKERIHLRMVGVLKLLWRLSRSAKKKKARGHYRDSWSVAVAYQRSSQTIQGLHPGPLCHKHHRVLSCTLGGPL